MDSAEGQTLVMLDLELRIGTRGAFCLQGDSWSRPWHSPQPFGDSEGRFLSPLRLPVPPSRLYLQEHPDEILPLHSCQFAISRSAPDQQIFPRRCHRLEVRPRTPLQIS